MSGIKPGSAGPYAVAMQCKPNLRGSLFVGHPAGLAFGQAKDGDEWYLSTPTIELLLTHPSVRARMIKEAVDDGHWVFWSDPYTADLFPPEQVIVISEAGNAAPLTSHPEFNRWKGMPSGEMWSTLGEDWVDEVKP